MSYQNLVLLQDIAKTIAALCFLGGLGFLIAGLIRTRWVRLSKRIWVVLITLAVWTLGFAIFGGTIFYTHSQPNGPHSFTSYMDGMTAKMCITRPKLDICEELKQKCATGDDTHPSCRIMAGEDPRKFYTTTSR